MVSKIISIFLSKVALIGATLLLFTQVAQAGDDPAVEPGPLRTRPGSFALKLEPGLAIPMTDPQSRIYNFGGAFMVKALIAVTPYLDLGPSVSFYALPTG